MKLTATIKGPKGFYPGFVVKGHTLRDCLGQIEEKMTTLPDEFDGQKLADWQEIVFTVERTTARA